MSPPTLIFLEPIKFFCFIIFSEYLKNNLANCMACIIFYIPVLDGNGITGNFDIILIIFLGYCLLSHSPCRKSMLVEL